MIGVICVGRVWDLQRTPSPGETAMVMSDYNIAGHEKRVTDACCRPIGVCLRFYDRNGPATWDQLGRDNRENRYGYIYFRHLRRRCNILK